MQFTHEHRELARTTRRIIAEHLDPYLDEWEAAQMFPAHQVMKALGSAGLLGIGKPAEYGGMELDFSYEMVFAETLGEVRSSGLSSAIGVQSTMCTPALARHGSDALKRAYLAPTIAGDLVGCIGVSEASAGSDVSQIKTWARRDGDDYVINGSKMWITNGVQGDWICLLCNTSQEGGPHKNKSLIIEETIAYAGQRQVFGGTVLSNQVVYHKLAQMQTEIEALRSLLYRAIGQYLDGQDITQLASMAKYCAGRLSMRIPNECLQFWGGQGVMNENWISRAYRDLRQTAIGGGANEIMLEVIAKTMGIHPGKRA